MSELYDEPDVFTDSGTHSPSLFGRRDILTAETEITRDNLPRVLANALAVHNQNSAEIDYLYKYMRGNQPVLYRKKKIRPEICSRTVENHAVSIVSFLASTFLGEPLTYVRRGDNDNVSEDINKLNDYMFLVDKDSQDKELATWMAICGVGYRMVLPSTDDDCPFRIDIPDPRTTFVVYNSGFGHDALMGVREICFVNSDKSSRVVYSVYTKDRYYEVENGVVIREQPHIMGCVPIFQYRQNMAMLGAFEPAVPLLDMLSNVLSCRMDGLDQFVQSFLKFKNCEIENDTVQKLRELGAIVIKSQQGMDSDVDIMSQELNQSQTQTLVDYLYDQILDICGMPTTTKGGASVSDTGNAVWLRDGWSQCFSRIRDTELLFRKSDRHFLKLVLRLCKDLNLKPSEIDCKFTRQQNDNLLVKTQALTNLLNAGIAPEVAIATCCLFNDPMDVYKQSKTYLQKWAYREPLDDYQTEEDTTPDEPETDGGDTE